MTERQIQFRVGLFVLFSLAICTVLVIQFGDVQKYWRKTYQIGIHFDSTPGLTKGTPVRQNGINIGSVTDVLLDEQDGGVLVVVEIQADRTLRRDSRPALVRTLLGDASIEFTAGVSRESLPPNTKVDGIAPADPMEIVQRLEQNVSTTLVAFEETSREWQHLARNVNSLVETQQGDLDQVVERAALALHQFTLTMQTADTTLTEANQLLSDPEVQANLKETVAALPQMVNETRATITAARTSVQKISDNLDNLSQATDPLADHSRSMVVKLDGSLGQLESLLTELNAFATMMNSEDGSMRRFASDPELYENLNLSAAALSSLVQSLDPILRDVRVFTDKVARHPELLGVSGALRGSSGLKDVSEQKPGRSILQTGGTRE
ncbi:MAG: MCE family protein [Planctomycetota bacterium]|nr:MAG: MCE family protein [Planctomycetota bacterium]